jgi:hypothetical protein
VVNFDFPHYHQPPTVKSSDKQIFAETAASLSRSHASVHGANASLLFFQSDYSESTGVVFRQ